MVTNKGLLEIKEIFLIRYKMRNEIGCVNRLQTSHDMSIYESLYF